MPHTSRSPLALAGLLAGAGIAHFVMPRPFDAMVPRVLPGPARAWTQASGVVELALAAGVAYPRTRRPASRAAAAFFVGVLPANIQMAADWGDKPRVLRNGAYARLPLQIPLILWARHVGRAAS